MRRVWVWHLCQTKAGLQQVLILLKGRVLISSVSPLGVADVPL